MCGVSVTLLPCKVYSLFNVRMYYSQPSSCCQTVGDLNAHQCDSEPAFLFATETRLFCTSKPRLFIASIFIQILCCCVYNLRKQPIHLLFTNNRSVNFVNLSTINNLPNISCCHVAQLLGGKLSILIVIAYPKKTIFIVCHNIKSLLKSHTL